MAQKDLKFLWGTNSKMSGSDAPDIVDGKAYFAIVNGTTKYPDSAAPANEAFIYLDKDNNRYNVIAKRAIFDALGNKIHTKYATEIDASGNTMTLYAPGDAGNNATALGSASIIQAVALSTAESDKNYYKIKATVNGVASNAYALVVADSTHAGIVTANAQEIGGIKTFTDTTASQSHTTGAVIVKGGVGIAKTLYVGSQTNTNTLAISNTGAVAHLLFMRPNINYIKTMASGYIGFVPNGKDLSAANCDLIIKDGSVYPGATNLVGLGDSAHQWQTVYSRNYRSHGLMVIETGAVTADGATLTIQPKSTSHWYQGINTSLIFYHKDYSDNTTTERFRLTADGNLQINTNINPKANKTYTLGTSSYQWKNIYATTFTGNLTGKLTTARNISLGTGATSTPIGFDGSADIVLPVTEVKETYLTWGGKSTDGAVSPIGASLSSEHSANRIAYLNPAAINIEHSNDGGTTWTDAGIADNDKIKLVTTATNVNIGSATTVTTNHRTRITLTAQNGTTGYVYTRPRKLLLNVSSAGHGMSVLIEAKKGTSGATWETLGTYVLKGWSGWNDIPLNISSFGGGITQTGQYWYLRLTFNTTSISSSYQNTKSTIIGMRLFGDTCWTRTSNMGETGHLYAYDYAQNATFPAKVIATAFNGKLGITNVSSVHSVNRKLLTTTETSGDLTVQASDRMRIQDNTSSTVLQLGTANVTGALALFSGSYGILIKPTTVTTSREIILPDANGTVLTSEYFADYVSPRTHKHKVTHTPAGTVAAPVFTGSSVNTGATSSTVAVGSSAHVHTYDKLTTINAPTFGHTATASAGPSATTTVYSITNVGSAPSLSMSVTNHQLQISFSAGSVPTRSGVTVPNSTHTHNYDKLTSIAAPTFSHTSTNSGKPSATTNVPTAAHIHAVTAAGTNSAPAFTGTAATLTTTTQV